MNAKHVTLVADEDADPQHTATSNITTSNSTTIVQPESSSRELPHFVSLQLDPSDSTQEMTPVTDSPQGYHSGNNFTFDRSAAGKQERSIGNRVRFNTTALNREEEEHQGDDSDINGSSNHLDHSLSGEKTLSATKRGFHTGVGEVEGPTDGRGIVFNRNSPSSLYEEVICLQLKELLERVQLSWKDTGKIFRSLFFRFLFSQNWAVLVTCGMLCVSCIIQPLASTIICTGIFILLYAVCMFNQGYIIWERVMENKFRTADVINAVLMRWAKRIVVMREMPGQSPMKRRQVFLQTFAHLPSSAFRMLAVVDDRTFRLKPIMKCLMVKRCKRLDKVCLSVRRYMEPKGICKLIDVMGISLESNAIVLRPLVDRARPPRLPNLLMSSKRFVEEEATTDESDGERESRTSLGGGNSISISQHMEYFIHRVFLLFWIVAMVFTIGAGVIYYFCVDAPLAEGVFRDPSVALLGLLPLNATMINRFLVLYANVYLDKLFHYIVCKKVHDVDDRLPRFSMFATLWTLIRIILHKNPNNGSRNPLIFSASLVDGFGTASVIAMLDQTGIVTDMVLLPVQVLCLKVRKTSRVVPDSDGSSEDNEEETAPVASTAIDHNNADGEATNHNRDNNVSTRSQAFAARERQREMKRQIKRNKFQEERFITIRLRHSSKEDLAVEFNDDKELSRNRGHLNSICLCILLHALAPEPCNLETWTEPFRFSDRSPRWCRSMHWLPRACGFSDSVVRNFKILARIFQIDTKTETEYRNNYPEQACSLLVEDGNGMLHIFTLGTPYLVNRCSHTHWTGTTVDEFDAEEKEEILYMGKHQWEEGMSLETVALAHRVLPERYRPYVNNLRRDVEPYNEFFFQDGFAVTSKTVLAHRKRRGYRSRMNREGAPSADEGCVPSGFSGEAWEQEHSLREGSHPFRLSEDPSGWDSSCTSGEGIGLASSGSRHFSRSMHGQHRTDYLNPDDEETAGRWQESLRHPHHHHHRSFNDRATHHRRSSSSPSLYKATKAFRAPLQKRRRSASLGAFPLSQPESDDFITPQTFVQLMVSTSQTFLGLVGLRDSVRPNVQSAMSALEGAGVRCMYFSSGNERQTKSFGSRVGLETDWNCCISLKEESVALDPHSIRAQLPFGIKSIRKHILHVDSIPLQVNLFSHAHGVATRAMLSILQDNHEVVVAVGSVFNHSNIRSFVQADLPIGVLPTRRGPNAEKEAHLKQYKIYEPSDFSVMEESENRDIPLYRNVAELLSCSCSLKAPPTTSILPIIATMVRQARLRLSGIGNCGEFIMHANVLVVMLNCFSLVLGAPLLITSMMTIFVLNIIIPILALSCTYTAYSGMDPMRAMTSRHNYFVRRAIVKHSALVWCCRYIPSLIALLALGITASTHRCKSNMVHLFSHSQDDCLASAQGYVALTLNYWLMIHCWTHISRHHSISLNFSLRLGHGKRSTYLFTSLRWMVINFVVSALSVLFVLMDTPVSALGAAFFPSLPHFMISLLFPIVLLALDWPIKQWREQRFNNMQKFRKLSFGTRLGMHSPRGDYEPEGVTYNNNTVDGGEGASGVGGDWGEERTSKQCLKRISEWFYRYTTMQNGKLELNCVCCDHIGGNYATYHVTSNI